MNSNFSLFFASLFLFSFDPLDDDEHNIKICMYITHVLRTLHVSKCWKCDAARVFSKGTTTKKNCICRINVERRCANKPYDIISHFYLKFIHSMLKRVRGRESERSGEMETASKSERRKWQMVFVRKKNHTTNRIIGSSVSRVSKRREPNNENGKCRSKRIPSRILLQIFPFIILLLSNSI